MILLQAKRPDTMLGVICGSLCIAEEAFRKRFADYQAYLERCPLLVINMFITLYYRGQVMNAEMIANLVDVELIYEETKYSLKVNLTRYIHNYK